MPTPESDGLIRIGDLARRLRITPRTLRFYEDLGLLAPASRTQGGFRLYTMEEARCVEAVLALKEAGFSLDEIRELRRLGVDLRPASTAAARMRTCIGARRLEMEARIEKLRGSLAELERMEAVLEDCQDCGRSRLDGDCQECLEMRCSGVLPKGLAALLS